MNLPDLSWFVYAPLLGAVLLGLTPFRRGRAPMSLALDGLGATVPQPRRPGGERISAAMRVWTIEHADGGAAQAQATVPRPEPPPPDPAPPQAAPVPAAKLPAPDLQTVNCRPVQEIDFVAPQVKIFDFESQATPNYYEALQISRRADHETIHRIYRIMAARYHPDNPVSGDHKQFLQLTEAYEVLADSERRAEYDAALQAHEMQPLPIFGLRAFTAGVQGETNRRLGVLSLLYQRRRTNQSYPGISVLELESRMALPREHLEFTLWYLRSKALVLITEERSDYALTAAGVDHIESYRSRNEIVRELLTAPGESEPAEPASRRRAFRKRRLQLRDK